MEWQTKALAGFLAGLSTSKEGNKEMNQAAQKLSMYSGKKKTDRPTTDHLPPEDGKVVKAKSNGAQDSGPRAGSFEKLNSIFGGAGTMFTFPRPADSAE